MDRDEEDRDGVDRLDEDRDDEDRGALDRDGVDRDDEVRGVPEEREDPVRLRVGALERLAMSRGYPRVPPITGVTQVTRVAVRRGSPERRERALAELMRGWPEGPRPGRRG